MNKKMFSNPRHTFSIVMFIQEDSLANLEKEIQEIGKQKNVKFVIQPCPYEGIEFLYQTHLEFPSSHQSQEKELFWHAIEFSRSLDENVLEKVSDSHHQFLVSILENDTKKISKQKKVLESLVQKYQ